MATTRVEKLAQLARLDLSGEQKTALSKDFDCMLEFVDELEGVDVAGVEPLYNVIGESLVLREDTSQEMQISSESLLQTRTQELSRALSSYQKLLNRKA